MSSRATYMAFRFPVVTPKEPTLTLRNRGTTTARFIAWPSTRGRLRDISDGKYDLFVYHRLMEIMEGDVERE